MQLAIFPTRLSFRPSTRAGRDGIMLPSVAVDAVASTRPNAIAVAKAMAAMFCRRRFGGPPAEVLKERALVGDPVEGVDGPYLYGIGQSHRVVARAIPTRIDAQNASVLSQILSGLSAGGAEDVIIDAAMLSFADSSGIASLIEHRNNLRMHIFRPSEGLLKIIKQLQLHKAMGVHPDLMDALNAVAAQRRHSPGRIRTPPTAARRPGQ